MLTFVIDEEVEVLAELSLVFGDGRQQAGEVVEGYDNILGVPGYVDDLTTNIISNYNVDGDGSVLYNPSKNHNRL